MVSVFPMQLTLPITKSSIGNTTYSQFHEKDLCIRISQLVPCLWREIFIRVCLPSCCHGDACPTVAETTCLLKAKRPSKCLESCLENWKHGDIEGLLHEGHTIQSRFRPLPTNNINDQQKRMTKKKFAKFETRQSKNCFASTRQPHKGWSAQLNNTIQVN